MNKNEEYNSTYKYNMLFNTIPENNTDDDDKKFNTNLISDIDLQNFDPKRHEYYTNLLNIYNNDYETLKKLLSKYNSIKSFKEKEKKIIREINNYVNRLTIQSGGRGYSGGSGSSGDELNKIEKDCDKMINTTGDLLKESAAVLLASNNDITSITGLVNNLISCSKISAEDEETANSISGSSSGSSPGSRSETPSETPSGSRSGTPSGSRPVTPSGTPSGTPRLRPPLSLDNKALATAIDSFAKVSKQLLSSSAQINKQPNQVSVLIVVETSKRLAQLLQDNKIKSAQVNEALKSAIKVSTKLKLASANIIINDDTAKIIDDAGKDALSSAIAAAGAAAKDVSGAAAKDVSGDLSVSGAEAEDALAVAIRDYATKIGKHLLNSNPQLHTGTITNAINNATEITRTLQEVKNPSSIVQDSLSHAIEISTKLKLVDEKTNVEAAANNALSISNSIAAAEDVKEDGATDDISQGSNSSNSNSSNNRGDRISDNALSVSINKLANTVAHGLSNGKVQLLPDTITNALKTTTEIATTLLGVKKRSVAINDSLKKAIDIAIKLKSVDIQGNVAEAANTALTYAIRTSNALKITRLQLAQKRLERVTAILEKKKAEHSALKDVVKESNDNSSSNYRLFKSIKNPTTKQKSDYNERERKLFLILTSNDKKKREVEKEVEELEKEKKEAEYKVRLAEVEEIKILAPKTVPKTPAPASAASAKAPETEEDEKAKQIAKQLAKQIAESASKLAKRKAAAARSAAAAARSEADKLRDAVVKAKDEYDNTKKNVSKAQYVKKNKEGLVSRLKAFISPLKTPFTKEETKESKELKAAEEALKAADKELKVADKAFNDAEDRLVKLKEDLIKAEEKLKISNAKVKELNAETEAIAAETDAIAADTLEIKEAVDMKILAAKKKEIVIEAIKNLLNHIDNITFSPISQSSQSSPSSPSSQFDLLASHRRSSPFSLVSQRRSPSSPSSPSLQSQQLLPSQQSLPSLPSLPLPASLEDTKKILAEIANALRDLIDSKLSIYEYDAKQVSKSFNTAIIHFEVVVDLFKKVAYEFKPQSHMSATGGAFTNTPASALKQPQTPYNDANLNLLRTLPKNKTNAQLGTIAPLPNTEDGKGKGNDSGDSNGDGDGSDDSVYSRVLAKLTKEDGKYKELIRLMLEKKEFVKYKANSPDITPDDIKIKLEGLAKKAQELAEESPKLLAIIQMYLKDKGNIEKQIDINLKITKDRDVKRKGKEDKNIEDENDKIKEVIKGIKNELNDVENDIIKYKSNKTTAEEAKKAAAISKEAAETVAKAAEAAKAAKTTTESTTSLDNDGEDNSDGNVSEEISGEILELKEKAQLAALAKEKAKQAKLAEDNAEIAEVSYGLVDILDKTFVNKGKEAKIFGGAFDPADKYSDDSLKTQYIETQRYNKIDNNVINEFRKHKSERDGSGNGSKGLERIKTDNKIEQLSNDIDVYNASSFEDKEQNRKYITRRIEAFENDPNNPIEELALTFDDRIVFIIATFFIRYITIIMIQWCIDINIIRTFYEGFIYYALIYIIIFWFIVLFINIDNSYEVKYMNFNGVINSIRTLFYYFYMGTNGISRLLIHTSLIIILIIIPIILNIKKKQDLTTDDSSPQDDNMKVLTYEERKQLSKALSLFTMFIWLFTSIIATKF